MWLNEKKEVIKNAVELLSKVIDLKSLKFAPSEYKIVEFSFGLFIERTYRSLVKCWKHCQLKAKEWLEESRKVKSSLKSPCPWLPLCNPLSERWK